MSHFEYISVAVLLIYSLLLAKLLGALPAALQPARRYWVHVTWILTLFFLACDSWWRIWSYREVVWNPIAFVSLMAVPSIIYLRAAILLGNGTDEVRSWREHYYSVRRPFFLLQLLGTANYAFSHQFISGVALVSSAWDMFAIALLAGLAIAAAFSKAPRLHEANAVLMLVATTFGLFFVLP